MKRLRASRMAMALLGIVLLPHSVEGFGSFRTAATTVSHHWSSPPRLSPALRVSPSLLHKRPISKKGRYTATTTRKSSNSGETLGSSSPRRAPRGPNPTFSSVISVLWLIALDVVFRRIFALAKIRFPSSLAGCGAVLLALLAAQQLKSEATDMGSSSVLYGQLQPGAALLAKWLPVFFVPSLVSLPLAEGMGSLADFLKVSAVIVGGFFFSLLTTAYAVAAVRRKVTTSSPSSETPPPLSAKTNATQPIESNTTKVVSTATTATAKTSSKPFSRKLVGQLTLTAAVSGLLGAVGFVGAAASQGLTAICFLTTTLASFAFGARLPTLFTKLVHPLVTCTCLTWAVVALMATLTGHTFRKMLRYYRTGSVWTGPGDVLLFLLGPAVVSLGVSIFERRRLVRDNAMSVATGVGVATVGGVGTTALAVRLLGIGIPSVRLSLLSRNITSPLAMAMANLLGADASLAVSMVVITGLLGANFGATILSALGIKDPVARGLSMGAAAHGLGTAALAQNEPDAFSFSAIAMALVASAATVSVSIPVLRRVILEVALG